jgi:arginase
MQRTTLLGIPIYTLSKYRGMGLSVHALRDLGIAETLRRRSDSLTDLGDVTLVPLEQDAGPPNLRNLQHFSQCTDTIFDATSKIPTDDFVFCLGGECALIVGSLAGYKQAFRGQPGMLWLDAHGDFNTPETTPSGFIGGMCLAFACGRGPKFSGQIEASRPLLKEEKLVHMGSRDLDPSESKAMEASPMRLFPSTRLRKDGVDKVAGQVANFLSDAADWIVCHLDVDVIDPGTVPAVSYPAQGGLATGEVKSILEAVKNTGKLKVFDLAAYNPTLDPDQSSGRAILRLISEIF